MPSDTKTNNGDRLQALLDATRAEQKGRDDFTATLRDLHTSIARLEATQKEQARQADRVEKVVYSVYNNVATLIQLMAALWGGDRKTLAQIQTKLADMAFESEGVTVKAERDIKIEIEGDVK